MPVYGVVFNAPNDIAEKLINEKYPNHYKMNDTFFLVASEEIVQFIAVALRIKGDDRD